MAFTYNIAQNTSDSHQATIYWFAGVVPFAYRDTYNRDSNNPGSLPEALTNPVKEDDFFIIDDDCVSWQVSTSKDSHVSGMELVLKYTDKPYTALLAPEDWIVFWVFNDYNTYISTKKLVSTRARANHFKNAPKFIGRINSIFKEEKVDPGNAHRDITYNLTCNGFTELDSTVYYNSTIGFNYPTAAQAWADFGALANKFILGEKVTTQTAIPKLISICFAMGPGENFTQISSTGGVIDSSLGDAANAIKTSPNALYQIPSTVAQWLLPADYQPINQAAYTYADLLKLTIGIQSFNEFGTNNQIINNDNPHQYTGFIPASTKDLTGEFKALSINFNNVSVWNLLNTFLNNPINEMYSCLHVDSSGYVMPSLVVRQMPFSSKQFIVDQNQVGTSFTSLPRWNIDDSMILQHRMGRSNQIRYNYLQIMGSNPFGNESQHGSAIAYVNSKPIVDVADIKRAGLNTLIQGTNAFFLPTTLSVEEDYRFWNKLMADALFGSHLKFTGTVVTKGIVEPIVEGDNCVVDGVIYHIQRIVHSGNIDAVGRKDFNTVMSLTNGISVDSDNSNTLVYPDSEKAATPNTLGSNFEVE